MVSELPHQPEEETPQVPLSASTTTPPPPTIETSLPRATGSPTARPPPRPETLLATTQPTLPQSHLEPAARRSPPTTRLHTTLPPERRRCLAVRRLTDPPPPSPSQPRPCPPTSRRHSKPTTLSNRTRLRRPTSDPNPLSLLRSSALQIPAGRWRTKCRPIRRSLPTQQSSRTSTPVRRLLRLNFLNLENTEILERKMFLCCRDPSQPLHQHLKHSNSHRRNLTNLWLHFLIQIFR